MVSKTGSFSPPPMALQQNPPRQADLSTPAPKDGTESVVQAPDQEAESYGTQADGDHLPHCLENG